MRAPGSGQARVEGRQIRDVLPTSLSPRQPPKPEGGDAPYANADADPGRRIALLPSRALAAETTASLIETGQLKFQRAICRGRWPPSQRLKAVAGRCPAADPARQRLPEAGQSWPRPRPICARRCASIPSCRMPSRFGLSWRPSSPIASDRKKPPSFWRAGARKSAPYRLALQPGPGARALGNFAGAAEAYGRAVQQKPAELDARLSLAGALRKAGRHAEVWLRRVRR